jgi:hypothetical protein
VNKNIFLIPVIFILFLSLTLSACGGEEPAPTQIEEPKVSAQTVDEVAPESSSGQPETVNTRVTAIEQLVGTWIAPAYPGNFVLTVFPDGKLSVATSLEDLERGSTDSWNLTIEDGQITATGYALCLGDTGSYLAEINKEGNLRFLSIIDACDARLRKMDRSLPGRLQEYILIYRPVD